MVVVTAAWCAVQGNVKKTDIYHVFVNGTSYHAA
jgi:hypothetical protein